jgi:large subunit ribosomal protein L11
MSAGPVHMLKRVRLMVPAVQAKPGPALGQALGPLGLNMAEFCKQFNDRTKNYEKDVPIPVVLTGKLYL